MNDENRLHELADLREHVMGLEAELHELRQSQRTRTRWRWLVLAALVIGTGAFAQLTVFSANSPAIASDVNGNFNQLKTWLEEKVGAVGTATVTAGSVNATSLAVVNGITAGTVDAGSITTAGAVNAGSITTAGAVNANSITATTVIPGSVRGGGVSQCNANSSAQLGCSAWGSAVCGAGCNSITCSRGTLRSISWSDACYNPGGTAYCYSVLCVE
jgi:hypothetical protein